ncbi:PEBP-like protein [Atractiella rhizophila]|nr:PEBP-like protein [Atractiella rhizophila]
MSRRASTSLLRPFLAQKRTFYAPNPSPTPLPQPPAEFALYKLSLDVIKADQEKKRAQIAELRKLKGKEPGELKEIEQTIEFLEVESEVNDPEVRWKFRNGLVDWNKPVYRHLAELAWRQNGPLSRLMQRITTMSLVPDLLPTDFVPSADLSIRLADEKGQLTEVAPGAFLPISATVDAPVINVMPFGTKEELYTLLIIDADYPHPEEDTFRCFLHQAVYNLPLSIHTTDVDLSAPPSSSSAVTHFSYLPPHAQEGTPYHRITYLLLRQSSPISKDDNPLPATRAQPQTFVRELISQHGMEAVGMSFFRQTHPEVKDEEGRKKALEVYEKLQGEKEVIIQKFGWVKPEKKRKN